MKKTKTEEASHGELNQSKKNLRFCFNIHIEKDKLNCYLCAINTRHAKISQLVNKMCSQQACSELVNKL